MFAEFLDDQFSVNGTLPRTLLALIARPGHLTREYSTGRIARYVRPFRLFLVSSVIFFIALSFVADANRMMLTFESEVGDVEALQRENPDFRNVGFAVDTVGIPGWLRPVGRHLAVQEARLNALPPDEALRVMIAALLDAAPKLAFALVPVFALLLLALHFRRRPRYVEHFVFALHYHAMGFLLLAPALFIGNAYVWAVVGTWITLYLLMALRKAYGQPWWLAALKFFAILMIYPTVLGMGIGVASLLAIFLV